MSKECQVLLYWYIDFSGQIYEKDMLLQLSDYTGFSKIQKHLLIP